MKENSIKKEQSSIEEDIKDIEKYISFTSKRENFSHDTDWNWNKDLANKIEHILLDYKRVLKENEKINSLIKKIKEDSKEQQWIQTADDEYLASSDKAMYADELLSFLRGEE